MTHSLYTTPYCHVEKGYPNTDGVNNALSANRFAAKRFSCLLLLSSPQAGRLAELQREASQLRGGAGPSQTRGAVASRLCGGAGGANPSPTAPASGSVVQGFSASESELEEAESDVEHEGVDYSSYLDVAAAALSEMAGGDTVTSHGTETFGELALVTGGGPC